MTCVNIKLILCNYINTHIPRINWIWYNYMIINSEILKNNRRLDVHTYGRLDGPTDIWTDPNRIVITNFVTFFFLLLHLVNRMDMRQSVGYPVNTGYSYEYRTFPINKQTDIRYPAKKASGQILFQTSMDILILKDLLKAFLKKRIWKNGWCHFNIL